MKETELQDDHSGRPQWTEKSGTRAELAELSAVASACEPRIQEVEAVRSGVQGQPELCETRRQRGRLKGMVSCTKQFTESCWRVEGHWCEGVQRLQG